VIAWLQRLFRELLSALLQEGSPASSYVFWAVRIAASQRRCLPFAGLLSLSQRLCNGREMAVISVHSSLHPWAIAFRTATSASQRRGEAG